MVVGPQEVLEKFMVVVVVVGWRDDHRVRKVQVLDFLNFELWNFGLDFEL